MINIKKKLKKSLSKSNRSSTWMVTDLSGLLFCDLLRSFHTIKSDQPAITLCDGTRPDEHDLPADHPTSSFPILTAFEPSIASDELL